MPASSDWLSPSINGSSSSVWGVVVSLANSKFDGSSMGGSVLGSAFTVIKTVGPSKSLVVVGISVLGRVGSN